MPILASMFNEAVMEVFRTIGGVAVIVVVLGFLFKSLVKNLFKRDLQLQKGKMEAELERLKNELSSASNTKLEVLKSDLSRNNDREIERFKAQLEIASHERQAVFEAMHKERADVISEVYTNLVKAFDAVYALRTIGGADNVAAKAAQELVDKFYQSFDTKRIYFTEELCPHMMQTNNLMCMAIMVYRTGSGPGHTDQQLGDMQDLRNAVSKTRASLETEFRKILGVIRENPEPQCPGTQA